MEHTFILPHNHTREEEKKKKKTVADQIITDKNKGAYDCPSILISTLWTKGLDRWY